MLITSWFLALCAVVPVSLSVLGYGFAVFPAAGSRTVSLAIGLGVTAALSAVLGIAGAYNVFAQTAVVAFGILFFFIYFRRWRQSGRGGSQTSRGVDLPRGLDVLWLVFPVAYAVARFFACGVPQQHSDPLYYHLSAAKNWVELGQIRIVAEHPSYAQAMLWESLLGIPQLWFGITGATSHVVAQLYGQWMHFIWGQLGSLLVAASLLFRLAPGLKVRPGLAIFAAWLCTTQPAFEWLGCLAKNDYVLLFFVLSATLAAVEKQFFLAGLLAGFAYSTKVLAAWAVVALVFLIPWRQWPRYVFGVTLTGAIVLVRNWLSTRNPVFPSLDDVLGPHWVSSWWINHNLSFGGPVRFDPEMLGWLWTKMLERPFPKILIALGLAAFVFEWIKKERRHVPPRAPWLFFLSTQLALALLMLRPAADGRYGNYAAALLALYFVSALAREAQRKPIVAKYGVLVFAPLALLINIPLDVIVKIPKQYWFNSPTAYAEQFHAVYDMQAWVNANVAPTDRIVFLAEKQQFYLDRDFETVVEMKKWEEILTPIQTRDGLLAKLRSLGFRYVHFSPQAGGYPIVIRPYWDQILRIQGQAVFHSPTSLIFDLSQLSLTDQAPL